MWHLGRAGHEHGAALAIVVFSLAFMSLVTSITFNLAYVNQRAGRGALELREALAQAEALVHLRLARWNQARLNWLAIGEIVADTAFDPQGSARFTRSVLRLNKRLFLVRATGSSRSRRAIRTVGRIVRLVPPALPERPPVEPQRLAAPATGPAWSRNKGSPAWEDCTEDEGGPSGPTSSPPDSAVGFPDLAIWGRLATKRLEAGTFFGIGPRSAAGVCDASDLRNWGDPYDPASPCGDYLPIIYVTGDLNVSGGLGQGILVVEGDLVVRGGFRFVGPVIVGGRLRAEGSGGQLIGSLWVLDSAGIPADLGGAVILAYSRCAVYRSLLAAAHPQPLQDRSWLTLEK